MPEDTFVVTLRDRRVIAEVLPHCRGIVARIGNPPERCPARSGVLQSSLTSEPFSGIIVRILIISPTPEGKMEAQTTARNPQVMSRLGIVFLTWRRYIASHFAPHGITLKQVFVLRRLTESEYLLPSQIASMLFCDRPTATVVVKNMERQGWVRRERDTADKRQTRVIVTEAGRSKMAALQTEVWTPLVAAVDPLGCFDEGEIEVLNELLGRLVKHVRALSET